MRSHGWQIASYSLPANSQDMVIQRVLIRHGFSYEMQSGDDPYYWTTGELSKML